MMLFLGGLQLTVLGILGEYLGSVFDEVKRRPLYIVDEIIRRGGTS
jgi:dolichol-phosphate mannosyltransferase